MPMKMSEIGPRWPRGTGQWSRTRILIAASDPQLRDALLERWAECHDVIVASTPLEVIARLEAERTGISTVVLAGIDGSASDAQLARFLEASYPWLCVVVGAGHALERPGAATDLFA
jgi:hypothetical protein